MCRSLPFVSGGFPDSRPITTCHILARMIRRLWNKNRRFHLPGQAEKNRLTSSRNAQQPLGQRLAQHPLVLLDQELKSLVKEDDDAINER